MAQRAGLHAAAVHSEGHLPPSVPAPDVRALVGLGLIRSLSGAVPAGPGPLTRAARHRITGVGLRRARQEQLPQVLVVPCSRRKADAAVAPAGEMYVGPYHVAARRAADAVAADGASLLLILSAKFGLLREDDRVLHYDLRAGQDGTVSPRVLAVQAHLLGVSAAHVTVFAGKAYADLARTVWPGLEHPLAGRGIGEHLAFFANLYRPARPHPAAGLRPQAASRTVQ
ncbi:DUF6884 domain-containing protein [Streptomyces sp. CAU 1734]|uniref:DUF6884 domain-containing protein n=1 Tax=Streptomyces sp. CAU 1734 TaxID=3140360 RepID=UPI00326111BE